MHESRSQNAALLMAELQRAMPGLQALDLLDAAMQRAPAPPDGTLLHPASPFGQVIAAAFDEAMTPDEWEAWAGEGSERSLQESLLRLWHDEVLPKFYARYGLNG
ncbi:MAG: hypothetical protein Fur0014_20370 [Rubrivivax sp.]